MRPKNQPMAAELCEKVIREGLQAYRVLPGKPQIPKSWGRKKEEVGDFLALFLQISPGFWKMDVRQRAFGASSLMVLHAQDPHELEPLVVLFHPHFTEGNIFHSHSTENGKISDFHSDSRKMTSLEIRYYATEEMPGFASQNRNPSFRINLKSISGIEELGGRDSSLNTRLIIRRQEL